ncbi:MAG: hypothetical protein DMG07_17955 [Acidobacteria bacterium]|nr:MAG: hypothetical protein DMG07_17955 [Acidobacteriota bacterium]
MTFRFVALALLVSAGAVAQASKKTEPAAKPAQASFDFKARMQQIMDAWSTLDPSKAAPFYSQEKDNVFYDVAPMKYVGWAAYAAGVVKVFADYQSAKITVGKDARARQRGNLAWGTATVHVDLVKKDGAKEPMDARWTVLWQKTGDDWLVFHEHFSVPLPSPPPKK